MYIERHEAVRAISMVIADLLQYPAYFDGGKKYGMTVRLTKASSPDGNVDEEHIRELFASYDLKDAHTPIVSALRSAMWSLLPSEVLSADEILDLSAKHFENPNESSFTKSYDGVKISVLRLGPSQTIRIDVQ